MMCDSRPIYYEVGSGQIDAQYFWYCAWAREAVTGHDPAPALERLRSVESMALWKALDTNGREQFTRQASLAASGDLNALAGFVDTNCGG
jgi:hypothetical protein